MWNKDRSVVLSQIIIKICYAGLLACCFIAPGLVSYYAEKIADESVVVPLLITLYACVPPALCAFICLDILLKNIKKNQPFIMQNVTLLRIISYCCFLGALIFIYFSILRPFGFFVVFAAAFFGIILRVVKNCFRQAIAIREENDYTI